MYSGARLQADPTGFSKVSFKVMTGSNKPSDKISVRYFFNTSEMEKGVSSVTEIKELYDQSSAEVEGADGVISGPFAYKDMKDTYYVEISWDGYYIANSGKKYQFDVGMYYGDKWDPTNDWSYDGLPIFKEDDAFFGNGNELKVDKICVYDDGVLVGGTEPDGTTASEEDTTKPPVTTDKPSDILYGDANCDGKVEIADATLILQYLTNKDEYNLTDKGLKNADVCGNGDGVTAQDALTIQQVDAGIYKLEELPVK